MFRDQICMYRDKTVWSLMLSTVLVEVPKNHNLESVSVKNELFFSPTRCIPTLCTHLGPLFPSPRGKKIPSPSLPPAASLQCYVQLRGISLFGRLQNGRVQTESQLSRFVPSTTHMTHCFSLVHVHGHDYMFRSFLGACSPTILCTLLGNLALDKVSRRS
jgi:hypothetical protein